MRLGRACAERELFLNPLSQCSQDEAPVGGTRVLHATRKWRGKLTRRVWRACCDVSRAAPFRVLRRFTRCVPTSTVVLYG
jgi:hypothetical protein